RKALQACRRRRAGNNEPPAIHLVHVRKDRGLQGAVANHLRLACTSTARIDTVPPSPLTELFMAGVRLLVGTRKGAFILTADGARKSWTINGPHFAGWVMYHLKASPGAATRIHP